jgi:hypothetical protein
MNLLITAKKYIAANISVIGVDEHNRAFIKWTKVQHALPTEEDIQAHFTHKRCVGIAIVCGAISGNLEVIDIDCKYDITGTLYEDYCAAIREESPELLEKLPKERSRNGGYHFYYKCEVIQGSHEIAQRPTTKDELVENPNQKIKVLIETRGEGGYVVAAPTEGYKFITENKQIPVISIDEREILFNCARRFHTVIKDPERPRVATNYDTNKFGLSPFEDYNMRGDAEAILINHGWQFKYEKGDNRYYLRPGKKIGVSASYHTQKRWFTAFSTSSEFEALKAYSPVGVFALLECSNDFSKAAKTLIDLGYGEKKISYGKLEGDVLKKKRDGMERTQIIAHLTKNYDEVPDDEAANKIITQIEKQWGENISTFWEVKFDAEGRVSKIDINRYKLERFLYNDGGFFLYFYDKNSNIFKIVQDQNGLIQEASTEQIKKFVKEYVLALPENFDGITKETLLQVIYKGSDTYFSKGFLEFLERKNIDFLKDTVDTAYFPFNNGVMVVNNKDIKIVPYGQVNKAIWKSQVIDFDIEVIKDIEIDSAEYTTFLEKICNGQLQRFDYMLTIIGYLLHKYKDSTKPFSVILSEETEDEQKGGGTGKGIFYKAISKILNVCFIDGKAVDLNKAFALQRINIDTQLVVIEDCKKNIDFEAFYSKITEGVTVEKKNKDELYISYADSPKWGFTTNYTINVKGVHGKRRAKIVEFSDFFKPGNTPEDFFGHKLFDDWDRDEWNRFYNMLAWCVRHYLKVGIAEAYNSESNKRKNIRLSFGEEYMDWWDEYISNGCGEWKQFRDLYTGFTAQNDFDKKDYSQKRFKKAIETSAEIFEQKLEQKKNAQTRLPEVRIIVSENKKIVSENG